MSPARETQSTISPGPLIRKIMSGKHETRRQLAGLPFAQKLELLEKLRDRSKLIASSSLRQTKGRKRKAEIETI